MKTNVPASNDHAIVIGGSMAGLLATRVLSESFGRVTIVERDGFPEGPEFRKGGSAVETPAHLPAARA